MSDSSLSSSQTHRELTRSKEASLFRDLTTSTRKYDLGSSLFHDSILLESTNRYALDGSTSNLGSSFLSLEKTPKEIADSLFKEKTDSLFAYFLDAIQSRSNDAEIFDTVQDLIHICTSVLDKLQKDEQKSGMQKKHYWLEQEEKTWKLLYALYKDRLLTQQDTTDPEDTPPLNASEKEVVSILYSSK